MNSIVNQPSDRKAFVTLIVPMALLITAVFLVNQNSWLLFGLGELLLSFFFVQTFFLLHECGHLNFFRTRELNKVFGHVFGFLTLIPYYSWQQMHNLHHRWTGWRDKDPTTAPTAYASDSKAKNLVVNIAWKLFVPIFYLAYKIGNYWNLLKIKQYLPAKKFEKVRWQVLIYAFLYTVLFVFWGSILVNVVLPAFLISLLWKEIVIMSQHSHVDMPLAAGKEVKPISYGEQVQYTRSFYVPEWISQYFLFNVNLHEAHHAFPGVPAYALGQVELNEPHEPKFFDWLYKAKSMKGEDYVFRTSKHTGKIF